MFWVWVVLRYFAAFGVLGFMLGCAGFGGVFVDLGLGGFRVWVWWVGFGFLAV